MSSTISMINDEELDVTFKTPTMILDEALSHLFIAIAALHRAGPTYAYHSDSSWHFAAGTWSPFHYRCQVVKASKKLPKRICVEQDVSTAVQELNHAVNLLREFGDERDATDLEGAADLFLLNVGEML